MSDPLPATWAKIHSRATLAHWFEAGRPCSVCGHAWRTGGAFPDPAARTCQHCDAHRATEQAGDSCLAYANTGGGADTVRPWGVKPPHRPPAPIPAQRDAIARHSMAHNTTETIMGDDEQPDEQGDASGWDEVDVLARLRQLADERDAVDRELHALVRARVALGARRTPDRPVTQSAAARAARVDRMALRGWLGLRRRTAQD